MKIKFVEISRYGVMEALGAEVVIGGKTRRNAVAFWTQPTSADLAAAAEELKKWAKHQQELWKKNKIEYLKQFE